MLLDPQVLLALLAALAGLLLLLWRRAPRETLAQLEGRLTRRTLAALIGGGGLVYLANRWAGAQQPVALLTAIALWLGLTAYLASRLRGRVESLAAYKRRIGYREPPE